INQITLNKYDIAADQKFKIDILSSRGLSQLLYNNKTLSSLDFTAIQVDPKVMKIFKNGETQFCFGCPVGRVSGRDPKGGEKNLEKRKVEKRKAW
ncbi:MAG: hypothetical protein P8K78_07845, partial [Pirellulales bacterium]|nr:hypothetical protein [Pirellulales bacterium]